MKELLKQKKKLVLIIVAGCALLAISIGVITFSVLSSKEPKKEILTASTLEKIINVSELSTYESVYNGIAKVTNEEKPEKVDFYVAYEAKVKAGIDFEKTAITLDDEAKTIIVTLPEVTITDIEVSEALDFIFENTKAETSTVYAKAYNECIRDAESESATKEAIKDLAKENAKNVVKALLTPFIEQLDETYTLKVK